MNADALVPGRVVAFRFLFGHERQAGHVEGAKVRPCLVVLADTEAQPGSVIVTLVPFTTKPPDPERPGDAIALPASVRARLGLGREDDPSWIAVTEINRFTWPGGAFDLRPTPDGRDSYGSLSPQAVATVRAALLGNARRGALARTDRDG